MNRFLFVIFLVVFKLSSGFAQLYINTVAGNGVSGFAGDGGQSTAATLNKPMATAFDASGNMYIADAYNNRVRKIDITGIITTIAGTGGSSYGGDGGPAVSAQINNPNGIACDAAGNIYISDNGNARIRKINTSGIISTFCGTGVAAFGGDGGLATAAQINAPIGIAVDNFGNLFLADYSNNRIRMIDVSGIISTIAGTGTAAYNGDGISATTANLNGPTGVTLDAAGNIYIADYYNFRIRKINSSGIISTICGLATAGYNGDGGFAINAKLNGPESLSFDTLGNLYFIDNVNNRLRMINTSGIINTIAGTGTLGYSGDGGPVSGAKINLPSHVTVAKNGVIYICDQGNNRVRRINPNLAVTVNTATICSGNSTTLTASGANTYSWAPSAGLSSVNGASVIANPTVTTTYTVTGIKGDSIGNALSTVTVLNSVTVSTATVCSGTTTTLTAGGAGTYTWSTGATGTSTTVTPVSNTSYTVTGSTAGCVSTAFAISNVSVNPLPIITISPVTATVCNGTPITLIASGANTYGWNTGAITAGVTYTPAITTGYTVTGHDANNCINSATITVNVNALPSITVAATNDSLCKGSSTTLTASGASTYTWNTGPIGSSVIFTPTITATYTVTGTDLNNCKSKQTKKITLNPQPYAYFTVNNYNPETGESIYTINNSISQGGTYSWDFGPASSPQYSTSQNVSPITYSTAINSYIKLLVVSPKGCRDSLVKTLNCITPFLPDSFPYTQGYTNVYNNRTNALTHDLNDNIYYLNESDDAPREVMYCNHGDSGTTTYSTGVGQVITKINKKGVALWSTMVSPSNSSNHSTEAGALTTDSVGNIYCSVFLSQPDSISIYSTDGRYVRLVPQYNPYNSSIIVTKFNKDGILQWYNTYSEVYSNEHYGLSLDKHGNLYSCTDNLITSIKPNGTLAWQKQFLSGGADVAVDSKGFIWAANMTYLTLQKFDTSGNLLFTTPSYGALGSSTYTRHMALDKNDNIYLTGHLTGTLKFGLDTITDIYSGGISHSDIFICKMKPNGQPQWIRQLKSDQATRSAGFGVKDDKVGFEGFPEGDTVFLVKTGLFAPFTQVGTYLYLTDTLGGNQKLLKVYENNNAWGFNWGCNVLSFNNLTPSVAIAFSFASPFPFHMQTIVPTTVPYSSDFFIGIADLTSLSASSLNTPVSAFSTNSVVCAGDTTSFTDNSTHTANSWSWNFPGGSPSTSNLQNPEASFPAGTYTVSLTASNTYGAGSTTTHVIHVNSLPTITIAASSSICIGSTEVLTAGGASTYSWGINAGSATTNSVSVSPTINTTYSVAGIDTNGCKNTSSVFITIKPLPNITVLSSADTICIGASDTLFAQGGFSYLWDANAGSVTTNSVVVNPLTSTNYSVVGTSHAGCDNTAAMFVAVINCTTGKESLKTTNSFQSIFPNPVSNKLTIRSSEELGTISIYNSLGEIVLQLQSKNKEEQIDVSKLARGIYTVKTQHEHCKLIKE
jgi:sugar lactone lactonase YvrE/PKD repeat protein